MLATLLPARRPRYSARKVKRATSRYLARPDGRPRTVTSITAIRVTITTPPLDPPGRRPRRRPAVFLVLVGVWCVAGRFFTTLPRHCQALSRWGHILLPVVPITIGLFILIQGGAFDL